jgi:hypothetical protein
MAGGEFRFGTASMYMAHNIPKKPAESTIKFPLHGYMILAKSMVF